MSAENEDKEVEVYEQLNFYRALLRGTRGREDEDLLSTTRPFIYIRND